MFVGPLVVGLICALFAHWLDTRR
ncbi:type I toxin-antitoxin system Fst family toxin [Lacticaseibacillus sp. GG6-2]